MAAQRGADGFLEATFNTPGEVTHGNNFFNLGGQQLGPSRKSGYLKYGWKGTPALKRRG